MIRIGVDFGGTKIEAAALDTAGRFVSRPRRPNPGNYADALEAVREMVRQAESEAGVIGASLFAALIVISYGWVSRQARA